MYVFIIKLFTNKLSACNEVHTMADIAITTHVQKILSTTHIA